MLVSGTALLLALAYRLDPHCRASTLPATEKLTVEFAKFRQTVVHVALRIRQRYVHYATWMSTPRIYCTNVGRLHVLLVSFCLCFTLTLYTPDSRATPLKSIIEVWF